MRAFYQQEHFLSLLKELTASETSTEVAREKTEISYHLIDEEEQLKQLLRVLDKAKEICIDTETTDLRPMNAQMKCKTSAQLKQKPTL